MLYVLVSFGSILFSLGRLLCSLTFRSITYMYDQRSAYAQLKKKVIKKLSMRYSIIRHLSPIQPLGSSRRAATNATLHDHVPIDGCTVRPYTEVSQQCNYMYIRRL